MVAMAMQMPVMFGGALRNDIAPAELSQRIAVIKRFKELLKAQRDRFRSYLDTLDRQKDVIEKGNADDLLYQVELEEKIVTDIFSIQKVIDPLEEMYHSTRQNIPAAASPHSGEDEVSSLKQALESLKAEAVVRSEQNRELLAKRMAELRAEIKTLQGNPYGRRQYGSASAPVQIDIQG